MTSQMLLELALRRWYLMALGAALTCAALVSGTSGPPVFWTQFQVVVLSPIDALNPNSIVDPPYTLPPVAGVLAADFNDGKHPPEMASPDTTLFGEGMTKGSRVRLRNNGTQWRAMYDRPLLDVQVVDEDRERVAVESQRIIRRLEAILKERQDELGVKAGLRLTTRPSPEDPVIYQVGGSRSRAAMAIALIGATLTFLATYWLDRWLRRRRSAKGGAALAPGA